MLGPAAAAQTAVVGVTFKLEEGELTIGVVDFDIPGATLAGGYDNESGAITGAFTIPKFPMDTAGEPPSGPADSKLELTITAGPVTGIVPPDGTKGTVTTSLTVVLDPSLGKECTVGPINLSLGTSRDKDGAEIESIAVGESSAHPVSRASCEPGSDEVLGFTEGAGSLGMELVFVLGEIVEPVVPVVPLRRGPVARMGCPRDPKCNVSVWPGTSWRHTRQNSTMMAPPPNADVNSLPGPLMWADSCRLILPKRSGIA